MGVGAEGRAEGIIHAHLAIERLHFRGELPQPLAVIQVDAENCFGRIEWDTIREAAIGEVPELGPVVTWKHAQESYVEQTGIASMRKNRGAEQGDTLGPVEAGISIAQLSRDTRRAVHTKQAAGTLSWATLGGGEEAGPNAAAHSLTDCVLMLRTH